jgi:hypothetical protein
MVSQWKGLFFAFDLTVYALYCLSYVEDLKCDFGMGKKYSYPLNTYKNMCANTLGMHHSQVEALKTKPKGPLSLGLRGPLQDLAFQV